MCTRVVDSCLPAIKFVRIWFVLPKVFKCIDNADKILENANNVIFFSNDIGPINADSDNFTCFGNDIPLLV